MIKPKRKSIHFFSVVVLAVILGGAVLAFTHFCADDMLSSHEQETACHIACHSSHHHGLPAYASVKVSQITHGNPLFHPLVFLLIEPPVRSIFHPPAIR